MNEKRFVALLWVAKAALVVVLAYMAYEVATDRLRLGAVFDPGTASGRQDAAHAPAAVPQTRLPSDYTAIVQRNLFTEGGEANAPRAAVNRTPALESLASAEELGLRLVGAIAGGPIASRAIIQDTKSNATGSYRIGDVIASANVEAIQRDAVILRCQGRPLVLRLRAGKADDTGPKAQSRPQNTGATGPKTQDGSPPSAAKSSAVSEPSRATSVADLFHRVTIEPYVNNDRTEGLKITGLEDFPMAQALGLQNGDIVQSVNGQQLTSKQKAFQVLMKAKTQPQVDLQLLRDGKSKNLSFKL
jgi:type II secretion system protein C